MLGLNEVGIFRLPGSTIRVNELKELFNEGLLHSMCKITVIYGMPEFEIKILLPLYI